MFESFLKPPITFPTLTGSIVTFNAQYAGLPLKSHKIALTVTQSGSGTPSPSNPRPITGYSAINISHSDADTSNPTVYTIQIGSTVYGGEYDARTGVLTVTHEIVDLGTLNWAYHPAGGQYSDYFDCYLPTDAKLGVGGTTNGLMCSIYKPVVSTAIAVTETNNVMSLGTNQRRFITCDTRYTDATSYKTAMNGILLVYELATPTTIQLPPCPIETLEGVNNIFADTGDTTLQYLKFG